MKKRVTLTIDADVYKQLQDLPRKVSISEVVSWMLKGMMQDIKAGKMLTDEEFKQWVESTPEGKEFRKKLRGEYGPAYDALEKAFSETAGKLGIKKAKKK